MDLNTIQRAEITADNLFTSLLRAVSATSPVRQAAAQRLYTRACEISDPTVREAVKALSKVVTGEASEACCTTTAAPAYKY